MILGGKRDREIRESQVIGELLKASRPLITAPNYYTYISSRAACYAAQFETLPVVKNRKVIAQIRGQYLAKLLRNTSWWTGLARINRYFKPGKAGPGVDQKIRLLAYLFARLKLLSARRNDHHFNQSHAPPSVARRVGFSDPPYRSRRCVDLGRDFSFNATDYGGLFMGWFKKLLAFLGGHKRPPRPNQNAGPKIRIPHTVRKK